MRVQVKAHIHFRVFHLRRLDVYSRLICKYVSFILLLYFISNRIRKNVPPSFSPGFGRSPNPGLAGDSKPRGGSAKPGSGGWPSAWAICWWLAGGQLSKAGGGEGFLARTPSPQLDLSI